MRNIKTGTAANTNIHKFHKRGMQTAEGLLTMLDWKFEPQHNETIM